MDILKIHCVYVLKPLKTTKNHLTTSHFSPKILELNFHDAGAIHMVLHSFECDPPSLPGPTSKFVLIICVLVYMILQKRCIYSYKC